MADTTKNGVHLPRNEQMGGQNVITQYIPGVSKGGSALYQTDGAQADSQRSRSWASLLCCVRPTDQGYDSATYESKTLNAHNAPRRYKPVPPPYYGRPMCPPKQQRDLHKKTLVLDLDETLVHSSFKPVPNADYIIPVEIDNKITEVYVIKRPWVDQFMAAMGEVYEVVVFTASLAKYADPLLDLLDPKSLVRLRLFRDSCCPYEGNYVKDLSRLGRELRDTIIIDNSPHSYVFQPENAIGCGTFIDDPKDRDLLDLIPFLLSIKEHEDVRDFLARRFNGDGSWR
mmetsp:Transcript_38234/g.73318  ORF Transcript_38234/g.73318 Transcript_38234/m.73318 type:complete len:285 (-) Transcript_38234:659-1513(-)